MSTVPNARKTGGSEEVMQARNMRERWLLDDRENPWGEQEFEDLRDLVADQESAGRNCLTTAEDELRTIENSLRSRYQDLGQIECPHFIATLLREVDGQIRDDVLINADGWTEDHLFELHSHVDEQLSKEHDQLTLSEDERNSCKLFLEDNGFSPEQIARYFDEVGARVRTAAKLKKRAEDRIEVLQAKRSFGAAARG